MATYVSPIFVTIGFSTKCPRGTGLRELQRFHGPESSGADANPTPLALSVPALWKGLLYDSGALAAASELASHFQPAELASLSDASAKLVPISKRGS